MNKMYKLLIFNLLLVFLIGGCRPEMPVTSSIFIHADGLVTPVNKELYGITLEEINHALDGGLYAELIRNRSFEECVPPLNCPYDASRNVLITPNGWTIPFMRADSVPGWRARSKGSYFWPDSKELINDKNHRSLLVSVSASAGSGGGGVVAEGYEGISIRKGEKYDLSFYLKGASMVPKTIRVSLSDSAASSVWSDVFNVSYSPDWRRYRHTFTATEDSDRATLVITADSSTVFWLDMVSLFPQKTWQKRPNGLRRDLVEKLAGLHPQFIRFPGGSFVEGYTAGTYPVWKETIGNPAERKSFWNVWGYGSTNGMGYHEFLQLCEDLEAEPIYVINAGVTSQSRRPRYEDITAMDKLVQDALDAIAYANQPADSVFGNMRAKNGHAAPFHLKYIEIGSENYGQEYTKRFNLFKEAIHEAYPEITVISSSPLPGRTRNEWADTHFYAGESFFISNYNRYEGNRYARRPPVAFLGEFGLVDEKLQGTLRGAIAEACFLIGVENGQDIVKRVAYAPVLGNTNYPFQRYPFLLFDHTRIVASPSYYMMQMFAGNRGEEVLKTEVKTYLKPQVTFGRPGIEMFDNSYEIRNAAIDGKPILEAAVITGGWKVENGNLIPDPNRWNYMLAGDATAHDYIFSADVKRIKGSGSIQFRVRDNGMPGEQNDYIGMTLGSGLCEFYRQAGGVRDTLRAPVPFAFESNVWYSVRILCKDETIRCYVNDRLIHEAVTSFLPSLVSVATLDKTAGTLLLKVVNTTLHEEKTELEIEGLHIKNDVEVVQLSGHPDSRNTFLQPDAVVPETKAFSFSLGGPLIYNFPPNSITLLKLKID